MTLTLSLVITDCMSPTRGSSRMSMRAIMSTKGTRKHTPDSWTLWKRPTRFTTPTWPC